MSSYNLIVLDNLNAPPNVELNTIICGSLTLYNAADFGNQLTTGNWPAQSYTLEINQQIYVQNGINVQTGSVGFGCNPNHNIVHVGGGQYTVNGQRINLNDGRPTATVNQNCIIANACQNISGGLLSLSQQLALLPFDSINNIFQYNSQTNQISFIVNAVDCNGIAVFNLPANQVFGQTNAEIVVVNNNANLNLIAINLSGQDVTLAQSVNMNGNWLRSVYGQARTIWNLYQAVTLELGNSVQGSLLAPTATIATGNSQTVSGVLVINSLTIPMNVNQPYIVFPPSLTACESTETTTTTSTTTTTTTNTTTTAGKSIEINKLRNECYFH